MTLRRRFERPHAPYHFHDSVLLSCVKYNFWFVSKYIVRYERSEGKYRDYSQLHSNYSPVQITERTL